MNRLVAACILALFSPVIGMCGAIIKLVSPGPVFYRAQRAGRQGSTFEMYKLRTMNVREDHGAAITGGADSRIFPFGQLLRRTKLDEVPQLLNIVRGEMAFVGPRPEDPRIVEEAYTPAMLEALDVLPGMTSPASLDYFANESSLPPEGVDAEAHYVQQVLPFKIAMELVYVRNRSLAYDMELIVRTVASIVGLRAPWAKRTQDERRQAQAIVDSPSYSAVA